MVTTTRKRKVPSPLRLVVATNLTELMHRRYSNTGNKNGALAKESKVALAQIQRYMKLEQGITVDYLDPIAAVFGLSGYQLLLPNLNYDDPQQIPGAAKEEERVFREFRKMMVDGELDYVNIPPKKKR
jgi:hypothetical protein